jgi:hypothetical protein
MAHFVSRRLRAVPYLTVGMLALCALAGCDSPPSTWLSWAVPPPSPAEQVHAATPRVSFNYRGDQEAPGANRKAAAYCAQYQSNAHLLHAYDEIDGTTTAEFECAPAGAAMAPALTPPTESYSFRSDRELMDLSRNAQTRCAAAAMPMSSTVATDSSGNRTVTFQCGRG